MWLAIRMRLQLLVEMLKAECFAFRNRITIIKLIRFLREQNVRMFSLSRFKNIPCQLAVQLRSVDNRCLSKAVFRLKTVWSQKITKYCLFDQLFRLINSVILINLQYVLCSVDLLRLHRSEYIYSIGAVLRLMTVHWSLDQTLWLLDILLQFLDVVDWMGNEPFSS